MGGLISHSIGFRCVYYPGSQTPTVSINESANVDRTNASNFTVSGSCSEEGRPVEVSVGRVKAQVDCTNNTWVATLDITGVNQTSSIPITARHSSSDGRSAHRASGSITSNFICPENFVGVPALEGYTTYSFCVSKYEMKNDGSDQAVSQATEDPYTGVSRDDAVAKCTGMGSGYDLLTNDGWQSMARHIELVSDNWGGGNVGSSEGLSQGHAYGVPNEFLAASPDDNKGCYETGSTCDGHTWNQQRRTHTLSNGEVIWDVSGNAWEWVKDDNIGNDSEVYGDNAYMSQVTGTSHTTARSLSRGTTTTPRMAKDQFGPSEDFFSLNSDPHGGLGYGHLNENGGAVIRGGSWESREYAGIFQVSLAHSTDGGLISHSIGFRCVYYPGSQTPTVSINESANVDRTNASNFTVSGSCSEEGRPVEVSVGRVKAQMDCTNNTWVATLDITGVNQTSSIPITARHSSSDGRSAHRASGSITSNFICPENFVGVPALEGYTTYSFCVSKYEMKNDGSDQAVSQATEDPYTGVSRDDAVAKCTGMGSGYDLLTNDGWQSMARHIELVSDNWSGGNVGSSEGLSQGYAYEEPHDVPNGLLAASPDDNKGCYETGSTCDGRTWNKQRRTHTLSNGEVIWDVSGNAWEWVKDDNRDNDSGNSDNDNGVYGDNAYMSQVTRTSHTTARSLSGGTTTTARVAKDQFGPSEDYSSLNVGHRGGLGYGHLNENGGAVIRGGSWESREYAGIFQVSLAHSTDGGLIANSIGFRCVYYPGSQTPTVSINESANVDRTNASNFTVSGSCSEEGRPVKVSVGGVKAQVDCTNNTWVATLDITGVNQTSSIPITARHSSSNGRSAHRASGSITSNFICPENFVGVPPLEGYTTYSFCVSKYEMKNDGSDQAVSQATEVPYTGVVRDEAVAKCTGMGSGYDLLTNDGWQSIARHIELVSDNWSGGNVGSSGGLSQGYAYSVPDDAFNRPLAAKP